MRRRRAAWSITHYLSARPRFVTARCSPASCRRRRSRLGGGYAAAPERDRRTSRRPVRGRGGDPPPALRERPDRLRGASTPSATATRSCWSATLAHLEERERVRDPRRLAGRQALRAAGEGLARRAGRAVRRRRAARVPAARQAHRRDAGRRGCWPATATTCWRRSTSDPQAAFRVARAEPAAHERGDQVLARAALHARAAPAAGAARAGLAGAADRQGVRRPRARGRAPRPYELTSVFGVGFQIADTIARAGGVPPDSPGARARRRASTC